MQKVIVISLFVVALVIYNSLFILDQTEQAIVLEFKKPVNVINAPGKDEAGLQFKMPWQSVQTFDKRVLNFSISNLDAFIAGDQKRLEVDAFTKYKINDPIKFLQAVGTEFSLSTKLAPVVESSMREVVSTVPLSTLLTERRGELMATIKTQVNARAQDFGIDVVDVRIMRADFPEENRGNIYQRMISERKREAADLRAKGEEQATIIRAEADKEKTVLIAEAEKKAQILKGEGEAISTKIFADSFGRDPDFFQFYRTMEAYRGSLKKEDTTLILSPDSEFLELFGKQ